MAGHSLTMQDFDSYDPYGPRTYPRCRRLCPLCGDSKPKDAAHRSVGIDQLQEVWRCNRCKCSGRLGGNGPRASLSPAEKAELEERRRLASKQDRDLKIAQLKEVMRGVVDLEDTEGQHYLAGRGVSLKAARESGLAFHPDFYGRPVVIFPIESDAGLIAIQGRYLDNSYFLRMRTVGPSKEGLFYADSKEAPTVFAEAPLDAISLRLLGHRGAVATVGTDLREWVPKYVASFKLPQVVLATDNDEEGNKAATKWAAMFRAAGVRTSRIVPPQRCKDWNEYWVKKLQAKRR